MRLTHASDDDLRQWAERWLERYGKIFHLAKQRRRAWQPELGLEQQGERFRALQQQLEREVEQLFALADQQAGELAERYAAEERRSSPRASRLRRISERGRLLASLLRHEQGLRVAIGNPNVPLDNNLAERTLRPLVIARLTNFGSGGPQGAAAAQTLYGLLATVRRAGLNPYGWAADLLAAVARNGGRLPEDLDPWLPWRMDEQRRRRLSAPLGSEDGIDWADLWPGAAVPQPPPAARTGSAVPLPSAAQPGSDRVPSAPRGGSLSASG